MLVAVLLFISVCVYIIVRSPLMAICCHMFERSNDVVPVQERVAIDQNTLTREKSSVLINLDSVRRMEEGINSNVSPTRITLDNALYELSSSGSEFHLNRTIYEISSSSASSSY